MSGATVLALAGGEVPLALIPPVVGLLSAFAPAGPLAHTRGTETRVIFTTYAHQRHERG
jgi:hypothetical protein